MKINGNLTFNNVASDSLEHVKIEQVDMGGTPAGFTATTGGGNVTGRILWNTNVSGGTGYYFFDGTSWVQFAQGGDATALQNEVDALEAALGDMINTDGTENTTVMNTLQNVTGALNLTDVLEQLDQAITGQDELAELDDVNEGNDWTLANGDFLQYNSGTGFWENAQPGASSGLQAHDAALDALSNVSGTGVLVQTAADTFATRTITASAVNGELGITVSDGSGVSGAPTIGLDVVGLTALGAAPETDDSLLIYDLSATTNKKVTIANLAEAVQGATTLGELSDITDAQSGTLTIGDKYFFNADAADSYEVVGATLGALNNVASGVDSASNEDILAFDGSAWTAVTPATFADDLEVGDIGDVSLAAVAANDLLQWSGGSPGSWENVAIGSASGVQAWDAGLDALAAAGTGMVSMDGDTVYFRSIAGTAGRISVANGTGTGGNPTIDLIGVTNSGTGTFQKITRDAYGRVSGTTPVVAGDITSLVDSTYVNVAGDTMTGNLNMSVGTDITLPDTPVAATDAVNKAYVDNLVASGTVWVDPVDNPDFVGIADDEPTSPLVSGMYIAYGGTGYPQTWTNGGSISVDEGDLMHFTFGAWEKSGSLENGTRLLVGVFTDAVDVTAGQDLPSFISENDFVEYVGVGSPIDPTLESNWIFPHGRVGGVTFTADRTASSDTFTILGSDETASFRAGNTFLDQDTSTTYTISTVTFTGGNTEIVVEENVSVNNTGITIEPEMRDGVTTLTNNDNDSHFGQTYLYNATNNEWNQISGPGSIDAGVGLAYAGTTLNVQLGAGIVELPTDEVGIDVESGKAVQLTTELTGGQLTLVLDGSSLEQSASGLKISDGGIFGEQLDSSIAGDGLSLASVGSPLVTQLDVNVDDATIEINADTLQVKDGGIGNVKLANSTFTTDADSGTNGSVALGGTLQIAGGEGIDTSIAGGTFTIAGENASATNKGIAQFTPADFTVSSGNVSIANGGVSNVQLANSTITVSDGTASDAVALGETLTVTGGTLTTTTVTANQVTIDVAASTSDLDDVTAAATASGQVLVADGSSDYTPRHVSYVHTQSTSSSTWTVNHSLGQKFVNVTVYDSNDEVIIPQSITATDANTTTVTLNTAISGTVVVMGVAGSASGSA